MKPMRSMAGAGALVGLSALALAQQEPAQPEPKTTTVQVKTIKLMRVGSDLVGTSLVNAKNEPLGSCEDLVIHPRGDVAFVEFSGSGSLKTGKNRYPIPWRALERNETGQFVIAIAPESFVDKPHYETAKLSDMDSWKNVDAEYAKITKRTASPVEAGATLAPAKMLYLASDLRSRSIENPEGEKVATMHEIVIDPDLGRIAYVVLSVGGAVGAGEKMIAVPWEALKSMPDKSNPKIERLTLATTREQLEKAPEFQATTEGWAKASEPDYVVHVYEYYALQPYRIVEKR
jgi:sporulation protein YlmC with PRC-barrel domain